MAYFRTSLGGVTDLTQDTIRDLVTSSPFKEIDEAQREQIIRMLEQSFDQTQQRTGATISSENHVPWLAARKLQIDGYYWKRMKRFYLETSILPGRVVNVLDLVTDEMLDFLGNPADEGPWKKRGMTLGHVQSGKTTNYSALICKAADAGYKIIILLTGMTNSLRTQTQERVDETFIGKVSVFMESARQVMPIVNYGSGTPRYPLYGTSRDQDFSTNNAKSYGVSLASINEPMIFITKKNKITLERLRDWLQQQNPGDLINHPLLLIDDEADNASINTSRRPDRVTAINAAIRNTLGLFSRSSYVGYTATPFANIFIDPDSEDEMLGDDLFPRNFIKALDPPENYVGATRVFEEDGDLRKQMIVRIEDYADTLPIMHKRDHPLAALPPSLETAIRVFVLTRAIRILRRDGREHSSMMINASRFNDIQEQLEGLVLAALERMRSTIIVNAGLGRSGLRNLKMCNFKEDFEREFSDCGFQWELVQKTLVEAVDPIQIRTVNMRGGVLDYSFNKERGLHVIAIGGLALSRGLTLEGLTVSYILRNASASDTLMQMARWFGYRPNYEDLCRLYIPESSIDHYDFVTEATEELRAEIQRMQRVRMTPRHFGLRVRHSSAMIQITAANKMGTAETMTVAQNYSGRHVEGYRLVNSSKLLAANRDLVDGFVGGLGNPSDLDRRSWMWRNVPGRKVLELTRTFAFSPRHHELGEAQDGHSLFADYFEDRVDSELAQWDVILPFNSGRSPIVQAFSLDFDRLFLRSRKAGVIVKEDYLVTGKNKVAAPHDEELGLPADEVERITSEAKRRGSRKAMDLNYSRTSPMMIVHMFTAALAGSDATEDRTSNEDDLAVGPLERIASLSFCMPNTLKEARARTYKVNSVYRKQMEMQFQREDDDDHEVMEKEDGK